MNSARFLAAAPAGGGLTALSTVSAGAASLLIVQGLVSRRFAVLIAGLVSSLIAVIGLGCWQRRFGAPIILAWLQPLAAAVFQLIAFNSACRTTTRTGARWKGRVYRVWASGKSSEFKVPSSRFKVTGVPKPFTELLGLFCLSRLLPFLF